jgi:hypothetical protein
MVARKEREEEGGRGERKKEREKGKREGEGKGRGRRTERETEREREGPGFQYSFQGTPPVTYLPPTRPGLLEFPTHLNSTISWGPLWDIPDPNDNKHCLWK